MSSTSSPAGKPTYKIAVRIVHRVVQMPFQTSSEMIARKVEAKKVKKAEANASSRLWKRLKPSSGKPRKLPPAVARRMG